MPQSERWAQRFFEVSDDLLLVLDSEGRIVLASPSWSCMPGISPETLESRRFVSFVHLEDLASVEARIRELAGRDARAAFTCRWQCPDGTSRWLSWTVSASASDGALYCAARPLETASPDAARPEVAVLEQALQRSEQRFRTLIEGAPESICVHRDRRFVYVNPAMLAGLRYEKASDLIGRSVLDVIHPDDHDMIRQRVQAILTTGKPVPPQELRFVRSDGSVYDIETVAMAIDFDGAPAVLVMARDITERKRMQARLLQNDRMVVMGTLAAGVGHEINNPLTYVLSSLALSGQEVEQLAQEFDRVAPALEDASEWRIRLKDLREMLAESHAGAERVRTIVRDLRILSRPDEERRAAVDVREVVDFSIKMAFHEVRSRARLLKQYEPISPVLVDAARLGQVFLNLLLNAAHAIPEGNAQGNEIRIRTRMDASGRVAVEVSDTGTGISPEVLPRIFEPFFTTKPVGAGTGLGLSICHGIIQSLGGEITVRSEVGRGSTFTVLLPAVSVAAPVVKAESTVPVEQLPGRILIIDDEPGVGRALARLIGNPSRVTIVESGQEALDRLLSEEPFDAIFCDLMMPDLSGMDLYEHLRERRPELLERFIFMTGGAYTSRARQFLESVPNGWLEKPFDAQQMTALLSQVLRVRRPSVMPPG